MFVQIPFFLKKRLLWIRPTKPVDELSEQWHCLKNQSVDKNLHRGLLLWLPPAIRGNATAEHAGVTLAW